MYANRETANVDLLLSLTLAVILNQNCRVNLLHAAKGVIRDGVMQEGTLL